MQGDFETSFEDDPAQSADDGDDLRSDIDDCSPMPLLKRKKMHSDAVKKTKGHYCCVPLCRSSSGQQSECKRLGMPPLSFHSFPDSKTARGEEWIVKIRRDPGVNFKITKSTKICSLHFSADDYTFSEYQIPSSKPRLRRTAVPSIFPWTTQAFQRNSITSRIAVSSKERYNLNYDNWSADEWNDNYLYD